MTDRLLTNATAHHVAQIEASLVANPPHLQAALNPLATFLAGLDSVANYLINSPTAQSIAGEILQAWIAKHGPAAGATS